MAAVAIVVIVLFAMGIFGGGGGGEGSISGQEDFILEDARWLMGQNISAILSAEFPEGIPQQMTRFEIPFNMPSGIDLEDAAGWKDEWRDVFANNMPDWMAEAFTLDEVTYAMAHGLSGTAGSGNFGIIISGNFDFASVRAALEEAGLADSEYRDFETWDDDAITLLEDNGVIIYGRDFVQPFLRALDRGVGFADDSSGLKLLMEKREQALIFQGGANCGDSAFFRVGLRRCEAIMETVDGGGVYESEISGVYLFRDVRSAEGGLEDIEDYIYGGSSGHDADIEQIETDEEFVTYKVTIHEDYDPPATPTPVPTATPAAAPTAAPTVIGGGNIADPKDYILADAPWLMGQNISAILSAGFPGGIPQQMVRFGSPFNMPGGDLDDAESWKDEWREVFADNKPGWMAEAFTLDEVTYAMAHGLAGTIGSGTSGLVIFGDFNFARVRAALEDAGLDDIEYRDFETWDDDAIALLEDNGVIIYGRDLVQPFLRALDQGEGFANDSSELKLLMGKTEQALVFYGADNCGISTRFGVSLRRCEAIMETVDGGDVYGSEISGVYLFRDVSSAKGGLADIEDYIEDASEHDADIEQIETDGEFVTYKAIIHESPPPAADPTPYPATVTPAPFPTRAAMPDDDWSLAREVLECGLERKNPQILQILRDRDQNFAEAARWIVLFRTRAETVEAWEVLCR